jgi:hypothetical protein
VRTVANNGRADVQERAGTILGQPA